MESRARICRIVLSASLALVTGACAVVRAPSGGPEDKTPPQLVDISPSPDSAGVARDAGIAVTFSEKLDSESFKNRIRTYPPMEFERVGVRGNRLEVRFRGEMPETTIAVVIRGGYKDHHLIESKRNISFQFSTADSLERGKISGYTLFKDRPDSTGVVKLFRISGKDTITSFASPLESRLAFSRGDGRFVFEALPTGDERFILWAFIDRDDNGTYSANEFSLLHPDTVTLTREIVHVDGLRINVIDPNEPGTIQGLIINETDLLRHPSALFSPIEPGGESYYALADSAGRFEVKPVRPGDYLFSAFIDMNPDSICGTYQSPEDSTIVLDEPCMTVADTVTVGPAEDRSLEPVTLKGR